MADPFTTLRTPVVPTRPDPAFDARLRARLEEALTLPEGVDVTVTTLEAPGARRHRTATAARAHGPHPLPGRRRRPPGAIDWYADVFGARLRGEPIVMPDGRIGHAELDFGGALVMLADEFPDIGHTAPRAGAGSSVTLHLETADIDALVARAVDEGADARPAAGGQPLRPQRGGGRPLRPPLAAVGAGPAPAPARRPAAATATSGYVSFQVPDLERAQAFYGAVLGWTFAPAERPEARRVVDSVPLTGLLGGHERGNLVLCWRVDDVAAAAETVRDLGGTATDPVEMPYGTTSDCTDDQGMAFYLWQPTRPGARRDRPARRARPRLPVAQRGRLGPVPGVLRRAARAGGSRPGRVTDGWNVEGPMPMAGLAGGAARAGGGAYVPGGRHRGRRRAGPGRGRDGHRGRAHALRPDVRLHRRPGDPLLPGPAVSAAAVGRRRRYHRPWE